MTAPYSFSRRVDGAGNTIYAEHVNELQEAAEESMALVVAPWVVGHWYGPRQVLNGNLTTVTLSANFLYFVPMWTGRGGFDADRIGIEVTTGVAGAARLGVYSANPTTFYPDSLIDDHGTVDVTSTGMKTITISETYTGITPSRLVWLALAAEVGATVRAISYGAGGDYFGGYDPDFQFSRIGFAKSFTYAALPASASVTDFTHTIPLINMRAA